jgi:hypothetical protein
MHLCILNHVTCRYEGIIQLTRLLNAKFATPKETQACTLGILQSLFPPWLPTAFKASNYIQAVYLFGNIRAQKSNRNLLKQVLFAKPLPDLSCKMNAFATAFTCQWLMGPSQVNDVEVDDGKVSKCKKSLRYIELFKFYFLRRLVRGKVYW